MKSLLKNILLFGQFLVAPLLVTSTLTDIEFDFDSAVPQYSQTESSTDTFLNVPVRYKYDDSEYFSQINMLLEGQHVEHLLKLMSEVGTFKIDGDKWVWLKLWLDDRIDTITNDSCFFNTSNRNFFLCLQNSYAMDVSLTIKIAHQSFVRDGKNLVWGGQHFFLHVKNYRDQILDKFVLKTPVRNFCQPELIGFGNFTQIPYVELATTVFVAQCSTCRRNLKDDFDACSSEDGISNVPSSVSPPSVSPISFNGSGRSTPASGLSYSAARVLTGAAENLGSGVAPVKLTGEPGCQKQKSLFSKRGVGVAIALSILGAGKKAFPKYKSWRPKKWKAWVARYQNLKKAKTARKKVSA